MAKARTIYPLSGPKRYYLDGREVTKQEWDEHWRPRIRRVLEDSERSGAIPMTRHPRTWPRASYTMGCHPDQVPEMRSHLASKGVEADFSKDGDVILNSPRHERDVAYALGFHQKNAGYSDAVPQRKPEEIEDRPEAGRSNP
jgi:hypothetical protein